MPSPATIWKRRAVLMTIVGLLVALPVTLIVAGGDEDADRAPVSESPGLNPTVIALELGIEYRVPRAWDASSKPGLILLEAPDRTTRLAISAFDRAGGSNQVLSEALGTTRRGYEDVQVEPGSGKKVGGLPAKGAVVHARTPDGVRLDILIAAMQGENYAYLVELFTADGTPARRLAEAQAALNQLQLTK